MRKQQQDGRNVIDDGDDDDSVIQIKPNSMTDSESHNEVHVHEEEEASNGDEQEEEEDEESDGEQTLLRYEQEFQECLTHVVKSHQSDVFHIKEQISLDLLNFQKDEEMWQMKQQILQEQLQKLERKNEKYRKKFEILEQRKNSILSVGSANTSVINQQQVLIDSNESEEHENITPRRLEKRPLRETTSPKRSRLPSTKISNSKTENRVAAHLFNNRIEIPHIDTDEDIEMIYRSTKKQKQTHEASTNASTLINQPIIEEKRRQGTSIFDKFKSKPAVRTMQPGDTTDLRRNEPKKEKLRLPIPKIMSTQLMGVSEPNRGSSTRSTLKKLDFKRNSSINNSNNRASNLKEKSSNKEKSGTRAMKHSDTTSSPVVDLTSPKKVPLVVTRKKPDGSRSGSTSDIHNPQVSSSTISGNVRSNRTTVDSKRKETSDTEHRSITHHEARFPNDHNTSGVINFDKNEEYTYYLYLASEESQREHVRRSKEDQNTSSRVTPTNEPKKSKNNNNINISTTSSRSGDKSSGTIVSSSSIMQCATCAAFYESLEGLPEAQRRKMVNRCNTHRAGHERPSTPDHFWDLSRFQDGTQHEATQPHVRQQQSHNNLQRSSTGDHPQSLTF